MAVDFALEIESRNSVFDHNPEFALAILLRKVGDRLERGHKYGPIHDENGSMVGHFNLDIKGGE